MAYPMTLSVARTPRIRGKSGWLKFLNTSCSNSFPSLWLLIVFTDFFSIESRDITFKAKIWSLCLSLARNTTPLAPRPRTVTISKWSKSRVGTDSGGLPPAITSSSIMPELKWWLWESGWFYGFVREKWSFLKCWWRQFI